MSRISGIVVALFLCASCVSASRTQKELLEELVDLAFNGTVTLAPRVPNPDACAKTLSEASAAIYEVIEWNQYIAVCRHITQQTCLPRHTMVNKLYAKQLQYIAAYMKIGELCFPKLIEADGDVSTERESGDDT